MKNSAFSRALSIISLFAFLTISGCGGGGGGSVVAPAAAAPANQTLANSFEMSPEVKALIDRRYSVTPELRRAAEGFATAELAYWQSAVQVGVYDSYLNLKKIHSQACLDARSEKNGLKFDRQEITEFLAALTNTPYLLKAYLAANHLSSGHPVKIAFDEVTACQIAEVK